MILSDILSGMLLLLSVKRVLSICLFSCCQGDLPELKTFRQTGILDLITQVVVIAHWQ